MSDIAKDFDARAAAIRQALDAVLDAADAMHPLFVALSAAIGDSKQGVNRLMRQPATVGQGRLNSVNAVHMRHRTLEASLTSFSQGLEGLYDHRRVLEEMHANLVAALVPDAPPTP